MRKRSETRNPPGFTLVEVVMGISILLISTLALGLSLQSGAMAARQVREEQIILAQAQTFINRIIVQEFGHSYDPDPTAAQIEEIFDADHDAGDVSLVELSRWPLSDDGWRFTLGEFPVPGEWRVRVDRDLNGNGLEDGELETGQRVFRISIFFEGRLILRTNRAKEVTL